MGFRCAAASQDRQEDLSGTASTVRSFLLVEHNGPWGVDALQDARAPRRFLRELTELAGSAGVRPLLVRRPRRGQRRTAGRPLRVFAAHADAQDPWLEAGQVESEQRVLDLDLEALGRGGSAGLPRAAGPLVLVCTHGRHDVCCAERGRPVAARLAEAHPEPTWEVSHIGGDRFAANLLTLPHGFYYGRVDTDSAPALVSSLMAGHLDLDRLRGRSAYRFPVQVAEIALLRHLGETAVDAVRMLSSATRGDHTEVTFAFRGRKIRVLVRRDRSPRSHRLTCRASALGSPPEYRLVDVATV